MTCPWDEGRRGPTLPLRTDRPARVTHGWCGPPGIGLRAYPAVFAATAAGYDGDPARAGPSPARRNA